MVTDILRRSFEKLGHEVYIFAPSGSLNSDSDDPHIVRFPAVHNVVIDEQALSFMFPPAVLKKIKSLNLDVIHFLTPGPVGLMAVYAAHKLKKPLVTEYCTDLFQYAKLYPWSIPAVMALGAALPFVFKVSATELLNLMLASRPRLQPGQWNSEMVKQAINTIHSHCDGVIVHSRKSAEQLASWQTKEYKYDTKLIPTGVDPLPQANAKELADFREKFNVQSGDEVVLNVGRLSAEKNLDLLVDMMPALVKLRPKAKLVFVGDFEYRPVLEAKAKVSPARDRIVFTGKIQRQKLGQALGNAKAFLFPSLTDTQGLVLHEAALAGLPLVLVDRDVSEVMEDGKNGFYANNDADDFAAKVAKILGMTATQHKEMQAASIAIASKFTEAAQAEKIIEFYENIIQKRTKT